MSLDWQLIKLRNQVQEESTHYELIWFHLRNVLASFPPTVFSETMKAQFYSSLELHELWIRIPNFLVLVCWTESPNHVVTKIQRSQFFLPPVNPKTFYEVTDVNLCQLSKEDRT